METRDDTRTWILTPKVEVPTPEGASSALIPTSRPRRLRTIISTITLLTIPLYLLSHAFPTSNPHPTLHLTPNHTFKISIFSDIHHGEDEHSFGPSQDLKSTALMYRVLAAERPDLVILNGDLITGENTFAFNSTRYVDQIVKPLVDGGFKWASTYGNHDSKFNLSREGIFDAEGRYEGSLTRTGGEGTDGVTNYVLPIYPPAQAPRKLSSSPKSWWRWLEACFVESNDHHENDPVALLWFLDSRGGASYQHSPANVDDIPNHVSARTAAWLSRESSKLRRKFGVLPSFVFVHIPIRAFADLQDNETPPRVVHGNRYPGMNDDVPLARQGYSEDGEEGVPFIDALLQMQGLHSVYSGHDHGDSWCGRWRLSDDEKARARAQPILCFCKHAGFGGYGTWNRGVRQVELRFEPGSGEMTVETWVRMEGGAIITAVTLNETYGDDVYPTDDGRYHPPKHKDAP